MSSNEPLPESFAENVMPSGGYTPATPYAGGGFGDGFPPRLPPRPRKPHPHFGWALLWMLLYLLVTQGGAAVVIVAVIAFKSLTSGNPGAYFGQFSDPEFQSSAEFAFISAPGLIVAQLLSIGLGWLALRLVAGRDWPRKIALRAPSGLHLFLTLLLAPGVLLLGQAAGDLGQYLGIPSFGMEKAMGGFGYWPWWLGVLVIGVGPGIGEELYYRGFIGRGLVGSHGVVAGVLLTSLLFGVMHVLPIQVFYAPIIGVFLHFVYLNTRSILMPMLLHTLNNGISMLLVARDVRPLTGTFLDRAEAASNARPELFAALVYGGALALLLGVGYALYQTRARLAAADGSGPPLWRPAFPGVDRPPPGSGTVVAHPPLSAAAAAAALAGVAAFGAACWAALHLV